MTDENVNNSGSSENKSAYYYANGQRVPLVREPSVFAVRYRAGRDSRDPGFSRRALRLLREESENIGFIPNYGLQLYRTSPAAISRRADPTARTRDVVAEVKNLVAEAPVDYAVVAYRRNPEAPVTRADELMFITREFVVQFEAGMTRERIDAFNAQYDVRVLKALGYAENGYLLEAPEAEGERGPVVLSNLYFESNLVKFAHPNFVRRRHLRRAVPLTSLNEAELVLQLAREDLSRKLGVSREVIELVFIEAVEWSDASLGCPQPDMRYPQVITPGYRLMLEAEGRRYEYHTDTGKRVLPCHSREGDKGHVSPKSPDASTPPSEQTVTRMGGYSQATGRAERVDRSMYLPQQWHLRTAKVVDAWKITSGSSNIKVAIIDDGVDTTHQEFSGKITAQFDFASGNADGSPNSTNDRHGTACAGVAIARGVKALGAAPDCSLIAVRYPDFLGVAEEADMFRWVADQGADVISCSWGPQDGTGAFDPLPDNVRAAIQYCTTQGRNGRGIPVFWAAGNGNESVSRDGYASNPDVIAVAASSSNERRSYYSDYGPEIFICAPSSGDSSIGEQRIFTVDRSGNTGYNPDPRTGVSHPSGDHDYTDDFGGTSSATPLVAGIAGLILSIKPDLRVQDVRQILRDTAEKIDQGGGNYDSNGHSQFYGYGRVNALSAVERARDWGNGGAPSTSPEAGLSISGPPATSRNDPPPTFQINKGGRKLYAVEVATRADLFDFTTHGSQRSESNFYGSWQDGLLSSTPYTLPAAVWDRLKHADQLFYRLHVADDTAWSNYGVTISDSETAGALSIQITSGIGVPGGTGPGDGTSAPGSGPSTGTARSVTFPSGASFDVVETPHDDLDYGDHVGNGVVPLIEVRGRVDEKLSRNFTVEELAATDGARYARISVELVEGLQRIRDRVGAPVNVNSGYRHPALNSAVGGATNSQHIAGRAADIRTSTMRPLELARIALEELGCDIGIGLGRNVIHVDLRGRLASWTYEGAELNESQFDQWVRDTCQQLGRRRTDRTEHTTETVAPSIIGPEQHGADQEAPTLYIDPGRNNYYAVEFATYPDLFDKQYEAERKPDNFYASWAVEGLREAQAATTYTLPEKAWDRLRTAERLYYRIVTSSTPGQWSNVEGSTPDKQAADALWIDILNSRSRQAREELPTIERLDLGQARESDEDLWRR